MAIKVSFLTTTHIPFVLSRIHSLICPVIYCCWETCRRKYGKAAVGRLVQVQGLTDAKINPHTFPKTPVTPEKICRSWSQKGSLSTCGFALSMSLLKQGKDSLLSDSSPWLRRAKGRVWYCRALENKSFFLQSSIAPSNKELRSFKKTTWSIKVLNAAFNVIWLNVCCFWSSWGSTSWDGNRSSGAEVC